MPFYIPPTYKTKFWRWYLAILVVAAVVVWASVAQEPDKLLHFYALNIGQGDSLYIKLPDGKDILIDGGPDDNVLEELGRVMPFYDHELDLVVATHNHSDHISGLVDVLKHYRVKEIWLTGAVHNTRTFSDWLEAVKDEQDEDAKVVKIQAGHHKDFDGVTFDTLFPLADYEGKRPQDQHDATIVAKMRYGDINFLLTGDLNEGHEAQILAAEKDILRAQILKVPHHGSATGLSNEFLEAVSPKVAIISVGAHNAFHHPAPSIIKKLADRAIKTLRTDRNGRVEVATDGITYSVKSEQ